MNATYLVVLSVGLILAGCKSAPPADPGVHTSRTQPGVESKSESMESKLLASEVHSNLVTEINFKRGEASISSQGKKELKRLLAEAGKKGPIDEVKLITWGDREFPAEKGKKLPEKEKKLAEARNKALEKYISTLNKEVKYESISMAERAGGLDELMASDEAKVKESLVEAGIPTTASPEAGTPKASKSIVIVVLKGAK